MSQQTLNPKLLERLLTWSQRTGESPDTLLERALNHMEDTWLEHTTNPLEDTQPSRPSQMALSQQLPAADVLTLITDAVVTLDELGSIVYGNANAAHMFGYEQDEMVGLSLDELLPESHIKTHQQNVDLFLEGDITHRKMAERRPVQGRRCDGSLFPIEISIMKYPIGGQLYLTAIIRDITEREATLQRLHENEKLLHLFTQNVTDMLCVHAPDGKFIYVSPAALQLGGYEPHELYGKDPYELFHPEDIAAITNSHTTSLSGQFVQSVIYRWRRKDGQYVWLESATTPIFDAAGNIQNLVTISRDIANRLAMETQLRQEHALFRSVTFTSPSGIVVVNAQGAIIYANQRAEEILGISKKDITALTYDAPSWKHTDYDGNPWLNDQQPFVRVMQTKQAVWDVRHAIETDTGKRIYLAINGAPIFDETGEISKVVFTVEDYTERKLQQEALEEAYAREKKLNELKTEFVSMVSHEFRTPMSIITTSTAILRMKYPHLDADDFIKRISRIDSQIMRLNDMITDITFINKEDVIGHALSYVPIDLRQFFTQLRDELFMAFPQHQPIHIQEMRPTNPVLLDLAMMQHIFVNLLSNAVKYSPPSAPVWCHYDCDGYELQATIRDEGIGIPEQDQRRLFELFHRASNVGTIPGTGLGLAITKRAVEALHGSISFESQLGVGTTFVVTLPLI